MSANTIMTPADIQKAAEDKNNKIRADEIQLRGQVSGWFTKSKPTIFARINDELVTHVAANTEQVKFAVWAAQFEDPIRNKPPYNIEDPIRNKPPYNIMNYNAANKVIMDESHKQCNLIGEFVKAQGHNLSEVRATLRSDYGITDINCEFTFAPRTTTTVTAPNTDTPMTTKSGMGHFEI